MNTHIIELNGKHYDAITGEPVKESVVKSSRMVAKHVKPRQPASSQTLMRNVVKKPAGKINVVRAESAKNVPKSDQVHRYGHIEVKYVEVPVRHQPHPPKKTHTSHAGPRSTTANIFESAVAEASGYVDMAKHHKHLKKKTRHHVVSLVAGSFAFLALMGFALFQNTPGMQVGVAGLRAGVATAGPNYEAAGFAFNGVKSDDDKRITGLVTDDGSELQLVESKVGLSEEQALDQISSVDASGTPDYDVVDMGSRTVYRLNNGNAFWVGDGTLYQLNNAASVSDEQLQSLADNS